MSQASLAISSPAGAREAPPSSFACTWRAGFSAAWVHVAGDLDRATSRQLRRTLAEAELNARLVMLDLRELTRIDSSAVRVIINAARAARRKGGQLMLARGPVQVDRVFTLTGADDHVLIVDLDPAEPSSALGVA